MIEQRADRQRHEDAAAFDGRCRRSRRTAPTAGIRRSRRLASARAARSMQRRRRPEAASVVRRALSSSRTDAAANRDARHVARVDAPRNREADGAESGDAELQVSAISGHVASRQWSAHVRDSVGIAWRRSAAPGPVAQRASTISASIVAASRGRAPRNPETAAPARPAARGCRRADACSPSAGRIRSQARAGVTLGAREHGLGDRQRAVAHQKRG